MSALTQVTSALAREGWRRWIAIFFGVVVFIWSLVELISLSFRHTVGAEVYGVLVAALAALAGLLTVALLATTRRRVAATAGVLVLWAIVGLGGMAGAYYHAVGVDPKYSPVDPRSRPPAAPLIFTALALVGGGALFFGQRANPK